MRFHNSNQLRSLCNRPAVIDLNKSPLDKSKAPDCQQDTCVQWDMLWHLLLWSLLGSRIPLYSPLIMCSALQRCNTSLLDTRCRSPVSLRIALERMSRVGSSLVVRLPSSRCLQDKVHTAQIHLQALELDFQKCKRIPLHTLASPLRGR